jgi:IS605 OrfB family transposase
MGKIKLKVFLFVMKTIKLKIKNEIDLTKELKEFNSIVRFSFNRFQEGLKEKEVRSKVNELFKNNCWFNQCAIKVGQQLFKRHKDKKIIFGGKYLLKQYMKKLITKEEYSKTKLLPINIQGETRCKGNRLFNFDLVNSKLTLKLSKKNHQEIEFYKPSKNQFRELSKIQELVENKQLTLTVFLNNDYIWLSFDESLLNIQEKFKDLKPNRVLGLDLNPNYIGLSVLEFNKNDEFKVIHKQVFDLNNLNVTSKKSSSDSKSKYLTNKRKFELIQVCYEINKLMNYWKCSKLCIEDLNIKQSQTKNKTFNRLCNNVWNRNLIVNKLKLLSNIFGYELIEVNPAYSSFIGNILYGNEQTPDMIASSIEIARRCYKKFSKGWFYPIFSIEHLNEQWKQTLSGIEDWKSAFNQIKKSKLKYRFQLFELIQNAVFSKIYKQKKIKLYYFI